MNIIAERSPTGRTASIQVDAEALDAIITGLELVKSRGPMDEGYYQHIIGPLKRLGLFDSQFSGRRNEQ